MRSARVAALALLVWTLLPLQAAAHPLGNFTVNRYSRVEVSPDRVMVRYVLDLAEIPTLQELNAVGAAGEPDAAQRRALLERFGPLVRAGTRLLLGGSGVTLRGDGPGSLELVQGQAGLTTMRLTFTLAADVRVADGMALAYEDATLAERVGWREIVIRAGPGVRLESSSVPEQDRTDELRRYPEDPLSPPANISAASATLRLAPGTGTSADGPSTGQQRSALESLTAGAGDLVRAGSGGDPVATLLALVTAAALGAFHALTPGHGKTVIAAYLVGTRGTARHALALGGAVAVSHTLGVLLLALVILGASSLAAPERLYPYLSAISAAIVVVIGLVLLRGALAEMRHRRQHERAGGGAEAHAHSHGHAHHVPSPDVGWRSLIALGVSGGVVPSASALLLLLAALSLRRPDLGVALIVAFGVGMAAVLVGLGLALVRAKALAAGWLTDRPGLRRVAALLPLVTSVVVLLVGLGLTLQAGQQLAATL